MNTLEIIEQKSAVEIFSGGIRPILDRIKDEVKSVVTDPSTEKGRKEIASLAHKVARSKTTLDAMGKQLGEDARKTVDGINEDRRLLRDELDALKEEVRKPLTDYEEREKSRVAAHEARIDRLIESTSNLEGKDSVALTSLLEKIMLSDFSGMEEFKERAYKEKEAALYRVTKLRDERKSAEEITAKEEAYQLAKEAKERAEREAKIAAEAAEKAKAEAEARALEQAKQAEAAREAERKAEAEKLAKIEREKAEAEARAKQAEADAKAKAEREAAEKERARLAEIEAHRIADEKRAANKKHREKVLSEAAEDIATLRVTGNIAREITEAIAGGKIRHASIQF
jgi:hypothetical protein